LSAIGRQRRSERAAYLASITLALAADYGHDLKALRSEIARPPVDLRDELAELNGLGG